MTIHNLTRITLSLNAPVEDRGLSDNSNRLGIDPTPEHNNTIIRELERAHLRLRLKIKDLESRSLAQSHNLLFRVHNSRLSGHRHTRNFITICKIDNSQRCTLRSVLTNAHILVGLHCHALEVDICGVDAEGSQVRNLIHINRNLSHYHNLSTIIWIQHDIVQSC